MPGLLTLLIVALAAAGVAALTIAVVLLRRDGRLDARRIAATGALAVVTGAAAVVGVAALQPVPTAPAGPAAEQPVDRVPAVTVADSPVDVQLPTIALDD